MNAINRHLENIYTTVTARGNFYLLFAYVGIMTFSLVISWSQVGQYSNLYNDAQIWLENNSWYAVEQTNIITLTVFALALATLGSREKPQAHLITLTYLMIVGLPFRILSYSASFPITPLWWSLVMVFFVMVAFWGWGNFLRHILTSLKLERIAFLLGIICYIGMFWLDQKIGQAAFSPLGTMAKPSWSYAIIMVSIALLTLLWLLQNINAKYKDT